ncbi:MAG: hypothetical protein K6G42_01835 [Lachnospiraceae bacterium]|nr:hypothetical protein [Lachnospiraceae bacterium]
MFKRMFRKPHNDNKGSALVMVIVALAFISILVATLMWVTMSNFFMKTTDAKNKETFYSAETVFEEIKAGMQKEASDAMMKVYQTSFGDYTNGTSEAELQDRYLNEIYLFYMDPSDSNRFDAGILRDYVEEMFNPYVTKDRDKKFDEVNPGGTLTYGPDGKTIYESAIVVPLGDNIQKTAKSVILKNITVQFYDHGTGNYSEITSDISIGLPNVRFSKASELPAIFDYSIIGDKGITIDNGVSVTLKKSAYAGENGITVGEGYSAGSSAKASLNAENVDYLVTRGTLSLNGMATSEKAELKTGEMTRLYAHDIDLSKGSGEIKGKTYVANDLVYSGAADMKILGDYFGFGNSTVSANSSSAMLINSKNADLDMQNAGAVILAGHAFVGTEDKDEKTANTEDGTTTLSSNSGDVLMDESISVKGDQVQYLIPGSCIGVWKYNTGGTGDVLIGQNPVSNITVSFNAAGQAVPNFYTSTIVENLGDKINEGYIDTVDFDRSIAALGGKTLGDYSNNYKVIYKNQYGQLLAYFYLVMTEENAKQYAQDYYANKKNNVDSFYRYYLDDPYVDESTSENSITTAGHYLNGTDMDNLAYSVAKSSSALQSQNYQDISATYNSLCSKLITDSTSVSANDLSKTVFENLINESKMPAGEVVYTSGTDPADTVKAIVTGGDYIYTGTDDTIHLIIAMGDVVLEDDFSGVVLAKGTVSFETGANIEVTDNRDAVIRLLQTVEYTGSPKAGVTKPLQYFVDGPQYVLEGTTVSANGVDPETQRVNFGELVRYENWFKR